jgi:malonyl-CoA O-methyltransferase
MLSFDKHRVASYFGRARQTYNAHATVQKHCAEELLQILVNLSKPLPDGILLEVGCGTGFVSQGLIRYFPDQDLEITDISPEMLEICQKTLEPLSHQNLSFKPLDAETLDPQDQKYALIISNFVLQWFEDPIRGIDTLIKCLHPGGILLVSFPNQNSFPEWKEMCKNLQLPFTGNQLPDSQKIITYLTSSGINYTCQTQKIVCHYNQSISFFRSIKNIGAGVNYSKKSLSPSELRQLMYYWDHLTHNQIQIQYHVSFLAIYA